MRPIGWVLWVLVAGCGRAALDEEPLPPPPPLLPASTCRFEVSSQFPAVQLDFPEQPCVFTQAQAAAGITFRYGVTVDANEAPFLESAPSPYVTCPQPQAGLGLYVFERVAGPGKQFCRCDMGLCEAPNLTFGATPGRTEQSLVWHGREWSGPSDVGFKEGPPFGPGEYAFEVQLSTGDGRVDEFAAHVVKGKLFFTITP